MDLAITFEYRFHFDAPAAAAAASKGGEEEEEGLRMDKKERKGALRYCARFVEEEEEGVKGIPYIRKEEGAHVHALSTRKQCLSSAEFRCLSPFSFSLFPVYFKSVVLNLVCLGGPP